LSQNGKRCGLGTYEDDTCVGTPCDVYKSMGMLGYDMTHAWGPHATCDSMGTAWMMAYAVVPVVGEARLVSMCMLVCTIVDCRMTWV
jgi:hypothetical protein